MAAGSGSGWYKLDEVSVRIFDDDGARPGEPRSARQSVCLPFVTTGGAELRQLN